MTVSIQAPPDLEFHHEQKSEAAHAAALNMIADVQQNPIGASPGDQRYLGMPYNYRIPTARIYVINHSRNRPWKRVVVAVSMRRGAEEAILKDKNLKSMYTTELIYKQVDQGRDMNRYKTEVYPVALKVRVPGPPNHMGGCSPGQDKIILPADEGADTKPVAYEVPEGTWDLYLGNYDRMRGIVRDSSGNVIKEGDQNIINGETQRVSTYWSRRHNPVFRWTDDGKPHDVIVGGEVNPYGFLEFVRVPVRQVIEPVNKEFLTALDIVEA